MVNWKFLFQHCCNCGSLTFEWSHLCSHCYEKVYYKNPHQFIDASVYKVQDGLKILSLGTYHNPIMKNWIKALKGGDKTKDYLKIAQLWLLKRQTTTNHTLFKNPIIIPSPSKNPSLKSDHAHSLALALAHITGWKLWTNGLLFKENIQKNQKSLNRQNRLKREFSLNKEFKPIPENNFIFIDDVITTGATAVAAYNALSARQNFEAWCIALQPLQFEKSIIQKLNL